MKGLNQFNCFATNEFFKDKVLQVQGVSELLDFDTKAHIGTKVDTVIIRDNTPYKFKDGEVFTNRFEKVSLKVAKKDVKVPIDAIVIPVNAVATIYGDFRNQLSVKCDDIQIVTPPSKEK